MNFDLKTVFFFGVLALLLVLSGLNYTEEDAKEDENDIVTSKEDVIIDAVHAIPLINSLEPKTLASLKSLRADLGITGNDLLKICEDVENCHRLLISASKEILELPEMELICQSKSYGKAFKMINDPSKRNEWREICRLSIWVYLALAAFMIMLFGFLIGAFLYFS
jgi:hypothetical protein